MPRLKHHLFTLPLTSLLALSMAPIGIAWAADQDGNETPFDEAELYFELNDSDGDLGIHSSVDGGAWKNLEIEGPKGRRILSLRPVRNLAKQGLTQLFFESAEPTFDELAPADFFARFPEGEYEFSARNLEGGEFESTTELTQVMPDSAKNVSVNGQLIPTDPEVCEADQGPTVNSPVTVTWDPVTTSHPTLGRQEPNIEIVQYEAFVERVEPVNLTFGINLLPTQTAIDVPQQLIDQGNVFKLEIIAREASGNQTAFETCFNVAE